MSSISCFQNQTEDYQQVDALLLVSACPQRTERYNSSVLVIVRCPSAVVTNPLYGTWQRNALVESLKDLMQLRLWEERFPPLLLVFIYEVKSFL